VKDDESSSNGLFRHVCGWETILISAGVRYDSRRTRSPLAPAIADEGVVLTVRFSRAGVNMRSRPFFFFRLKRGVGQARWSLTPEAGTGNAKGRDQRPSRTSV
jgi:hypothetical protein